MGASRSPGHTLPPGRSIARASAPGEDVPSMLMSAPDFGEKGAACGGRRGLGPTRDVRRR